MRARSAASSGIAADDQPLAGIIRRGDRRHVALVEQRELQGAAFDQAADRRGAQGGDPVEPIGPQFGVDAGLGDHAAVADQHDMVEAEASLELVDLGAKGSGIGSVAVKHFDRHRAAVGRAQQTVDDLQFARLAVAVVAKAGRAGSTSPPDSSRSHRRAPACRRRDGAVPVPVRSPAGAPKASRAHDRVLLRRPRRAPVRCRGWRRRSQATSARAAASLEPGFSTRAISERQHQIAAAVAGRPEHPVEADLARGAERRGDMAVRQRAQDRDRRRRRA